jgi:hypothetical protein
LWGAAGFKCEAWAWDVGYGTLHLPWCGAARLCRSIFAGICLLPISSRRGPRELRVDDLQLSITLYQDEVARTAYFYRRSQLFSLFPEKVISALSGGISPIRDLGRSNQADQ